MLINQKNKADKDIIIYHFDEESGCKLATLLILKGYNNIKLLTGGIEEYGALFKENLEGIAIPNLKIPEARMLNRTQDASKKICRG